MSSLNKTGDMRMLLCLRVWDLIPEISPQFQYYHKKNKDLHQHSIFEYPFSFTSCGFWCPFYLNYMLDALRQVAESDLSLALPTGGTLPNYRHPSRFFRLQKHHLTMYGHISPLTCWHWPCLVTLCPWIVTFTDFKRTLLATPSQPAVWTITPPRMGGSGGGAAEDC